MPTYSSAFEATPSPSDPEVPSLEQISAVLNVTDMEATAGEPARLANLAASNAVTATNASSQNAVANQQAVTQLGLAVLGKTVNRVANLGPVEARSSVDILTNNELAQTIADLKSVLGLGGGRPPHPHPRPGPSLKRLLEILKRVLAQMAMIEAQNAALKGDGTASSPYASEVGLYVTAPVTIAFPGLQPQEVDLSMVGGSLRAAK